MDTGCGKFGSFEWDKNCIESFGTEEEVRSYILCLRKILISEMPTLEESKKRAIELARVH